MEATSLALYADDTILMSSSWDVKLLGRRLQYHLDLVTTFFGDWKLTVNPTKSQAILFPPRNKKPDCTELSVLGQPIPWSPQVRYLGVIFDEMLKWGPAVNDRVAKVRAAAGALHSHLSSSSSLNQRIRVTLYKVYLRPVLMYGAQVWTSATATHLKKVQRAQNRILKIITGRPTRYPTQDLHDELNIELVRDYINTIINKYNVASHLNSLVRITGLYDLNRIPYKVKKKFPLTKVWSHYVTLLTDSYYP